MNDKWNLIPPDKAWCLPETWTRKELDVIKEACPDLATNLRRSGKAGREFVFDTVTTTKLVARMLALPAVLPVQLRVHLFVYSVNQDLKSTFKRRRSSPSRLELTSFTSDMYEMSWNVVLIWWESCSQRYLRKSRFWNSSSYISKSQRGPAAENDETLSNAGIEEANEKMNWITYKF